MSLGKLIILYLQLSLALQAQKDDQFRHLESKEGVSWGMAFTLAFPVKGDMVPAECMKHTGTQTNIG